MSGTGAATADAVTAATPAIPSIDPASVHRTRLGNGLTLLVRRDPSAPVVAIVTFVKAGYFDETDDIVGIAHVLEHMFFKGTARRGVGEIAKETKTHGGYLNAHTIYDHTSYYTVLPSAGFAGGLEIQADAYANSLIDAAELGRELEVIIQEAKRKADNASAVATETLYELLHDRHRMRRWRIGREAGLRALTRDALLAFYRTFYRPANTVLAIVGDVDPDETIRDVERLYGQIPGGDVVRSPGPRETAAPGFRYRELQGDISQSQVAIGWRTPGIDHTDTPVLDLASTVLGAGRASRLYRAVRERKLASSVTAYNYVPTELGVFVVHADTEPESVAHAARAAWAQVHDVAARGVSEDEVERARRIYESRWMRRLETMEGQANHLAEWEAAGSWTRADQYLERVLASSAADVRDVARRWLSPESASLVVYRPAASAQIASDASAMQRLLSAGVVAPLPPSPSREDTPVAHINGPPPLELEVARVRVYRTAHEVPVLVRRKPNATIAHLGVFFLGGSTDEGAQRAGLTVLMARTALKGTARRGVTRIAEDAEFLGGSLGVSVGNETFGWTISVPVRHLAAATELLADVATCPVIPDDAFETERAVALSEVAQLRDDMFRYPVRLATTAAFGAHPYGSPVIGSQESLNGLTAEQARVWHREHVLRAPAMVGAVADADPDLLAAVMAQHFAGLRMREPATLAAPEWPRSVTTRIESREKAQTALALAFPSPGRGDVRRYDAQLLAGVASGLGGRFFDELRDKRSLAYTVTACANERRLAGTFLSYIATSPDQEESAREGLLAEFAKLRERPVSDEELERAKRYAVGTHAIRQESGSAILNDMADAWLLGGSLAELDEHDDRVRAVTPAGMQALARECFAEDRRVEGIVRGVGKSV